MHPLAQPAAYFFALSIYWNDLEGSFQWLAGAVALRELLYVIGCCLAAYVHPAYLLCDMRASLNYRHASKESTFWVVLYTLAPEKFVVLTLPGPLSWPKNLAVRTPEQDRVATAATLIAIDCHWLPLVATDCLVCEDRVATAQRSLRSPCVWMDRDVVTVEGAGAAEWLHKPIGRLRAMTRVRARVYVCVCAAQVIIDVVAVTPLDLCGLAAFYTAVMREEDFPPALLVGYTLTAVGGVAMVLLALMA